ncbi:hypothetical protein SOCEGT47_059490 [Sorangium cellulosum]|uniref:Calcineurin-like phosphoesterase domain-containing protein n=1 Tax=Sorangium cellulosum TaxID=56 RepID=A0A4P2Q7A9_SORCE|nr:metallophosphoesterase family protein [Sorangium cellulosum]AUX25404.1 hypothetical protein SOCEGT47_059490 [Sorangium cellulosum]
MKRASMFGPSASLLSACLLSSSLPGCAEPSGKAPAAPGRLEPSLALAPSDPARDARRGPERPPRGERRAQAGPLELAVIGDAPYGEAQRAAFPRLLQAIRAAGVDGAVHVGDIKSGGSRCDDSYYRSIADAFATLDVPLVYTPGDNEWTDCHRATAGAYDPLERLGVLRSVFFSDPGVTLGLPRPVLSQATIPAHATFVENRMWFEASVVFSAVHVVGSGNGHAAWSDRDDPERRLAEVEARVAAAVDWIDRTFALARARRAAGVALFMQADTFSGPTTGFVEIVQRLATRARGFVRPVLLVQGDTHRYRVDRPLEAGSASYGVTAPVPNLTRVVVEGETVSEWLRLTVDPGAPMPFTWERVAVGG